MSSCCGVPSVVSSISSLKIILDGLLSYTIETHIMYSVLEDRSGMVMSVDVSVNSMYPLFVFVRDAVIARLWKFESGKKLLCV